MTTEQEQLLVAKNAELEKELALKNRELQIEAALERVRAIAMAMRKPADLQDICKIVYTQLQSLGFVELRNAMINIHNDDKGLMLNYDYSENFGKTVTDIPYNFHPLVEKQVMVTKNAQDAFFEFSFTGEELKQFRELRKNNGEADDPKLEITDALHYYFYSIGTGSIGISTYCAIAEEKLELLKRFRNVFNLSYQRYIDISLAEAQAREAEIELALERVRARTMAMQRSADLTDAANLLFQQVQVLGVPSWSCGFNIWEEKEKCFTAWMSSEGILQPPFKIPFSKVPTFNRFYESRQKGEVYYIEEMDGDALVAQYKYMQGLPGFGDILDDFLKSGFTLPTFQINHVFNFKQGNLIFITNVHVPEAVDIFKRFAIVFEQTYTRFLDLQKAETQVRESQIQLALERARTQSMIMQHSKELDDTLRVFHEQGLLLGIHSAFSFLWLPDEQKSNHIFWAAWAEENNNSTTFKSKAITYPLDRNEPATAQCLVDWKSGEPVVSYAVPPEGVAGYFAAWQELIDGVEKLTPQHFTGGLYYVEAFMKFGCFGVMLECDLNDDEKRILNRFAIEFERAYTRFLDLQKAEAQAREAEIELALERVRSRTMAMQKSDELCEIVAIMLVQLQNLGFKYGACSIVIIEKISSDMIWWISGFEKEYPESYRIPFFDHLFYLEQISPWKEGKKYAVLEASGEKKKSYDKIVFSQTEFERIPEGTKKVMMDFEKVIFSNAYMEYGFLSWSAEPIGDEHAKILQRFAKVFEQTYTRFLDLQKVEEQVLKAGQDLIAIKEAKQKAEDALIELKATQKQLIQSEKMASLGELTAGIAHEIQNPLNFVNNFSEVSNELIDEMNDELGKGDIDEAKLIASDIKQNLEKIAHHGMRAAAIVKGMLQHSRSSSNVKEPTDINALVDEYVRLCYHGLRAKDKTFNATITTDFDQAIGNVNIIPQDVGRVVLNLLTNAFYAVNEKKKSPHPLKVGEEFEPTVSVSTRKDVDKVFISVKDNGSGIPQKVLGKIFQPFFTTKPTGQGTGLGLSLSYDIIKAHGGEIKLETKEGESTEFIIILPE